MPGEQQINTRYEKRVPGTNLVQCTLLDIVEAQRVESIGAQQVHDTLPSSLA